MFFTFTLYRVAQNSLDTLRCKWSYCCRWNMRHPVYSELMRKKRNNSYIRKINPVNAELNPICHLLALLRAHHILHVSRIRVKGYYSGEYLAFYSEDRDTRIITPSVNFYETIHRQNPEGCALYIIYSRIWPSGKWGLSMVRVLWHMVTVYEIGLKSTLKRALIKAGLLKIRHISAVRNYQGSNEYKTKTFRSYNVNW
jgi:hypothetical protein